MNESGIQSGFKPSSLGPIPIDWEIKELNEVFEFINTSSFSRENLTKEKTENEIYYIHYGDIHATYKSEVLDFNMEKRVPFLKDEFCRNNFNFLQEGDLVIADASEDYTGIGESIEIKNIKEKKVIGGLHTIVIRDKALKTVNGYRTYIFRNFKVHNEIKKLSTGISVYSISKGNLSRLGLPIPPLLEETAIANCLSTWDNAISATITLLSQKKLSKNWLMQKLLTGKKRLKGFEKGNWKIALLENFLIPVSRPVNKPSSSFLALGIRSHGKGTFLKHDFNPAKIEMETLFLAKENDLIVNITFAWEGAVAIVRKEDEGALVSHRFPTFTFNPETATIDFFRHLILLPRFRYLLALISPGGAGRNRVLSKKDFLKLELKVPLIDEQTAIAQVLQAADKEIDLLQTKLDMLKEQKKGLMQQLLTGRKRFNMDKNESD
jgi:type I restriction enzyme, S subunit